MNDAEEPSVFDVAFSLQKGEIVTSYLIKFILTRT